MRTVKRTQRHMVDLLFTLALFCVFAASSLIVVIIGANVYRTTVRGMGENFDLRTSLSYVAQKVRQNDVRDAVSVRELEGEQALVLEQQIDGEFYQTWIYYHEGVIRELFVARGAELDAQTGSEIMEVEDFAVAQNEAGLLEFSVTDENGRTASVSVSPRS